MFDRVTAILAASLVVLAIGCAEKPKQPPSPPPTTKLSASKLTVLVVDDPGISAGLSLLRGEWSERSGGELDIIEKATAELFEADKLSADLIIFPSRQVGALVDREWIRPVRKSVLDSDEVALADMLPVVRNAILRYGSQVYALSLGEPPLVLEGGGGTTGSPKTWADAKAGLAADRSPLEFPKAVELLVRATAYSQRGRHAGGLFTVSTMQPTIDRPPFVRALEEMLQSGNPATSPADQPWALTWLRAGRDGSSDERVVTALPAAGLAYSALLKTWEASDDRQPLVFVGFAGRSIAVTRSSRNSSSAFKLLKWLVSESIATQLSPRSEATLWFRKSQIAQAEKWLGKVAEPDQVVSEVTQMLSVADPYLLPRIPGIDEYLAAVEDEIAQSVSSDQAAEAVLVRVVERWNAITERYGRDRQRVAYRRHLGLDDSDK